MRWHTRPQTPARLLVERLAVYPRYVQHNDHWIAPALRPRLVRMADAEGFARTEDWTPGAAVAPPPRACRRTDARPADADPRPRRARRRARARPTSSRCSARAARASARSAPPPTRCGRKAAARRVSYVVTRNINYTNVCAYRCTFCAFSKGKTHAHLRGRPYDLRARGDRAALPRGVGARRGRGLPAGRHPSGLYRRHLSRDLPRHQGGGAGPAHPRLLAARDICRVRRRSGLPVADFLAELKAAGLGSLPGTAAEILDDEVRACHLPRQGDDRAMARRDRGRASASASAPPPPSCSAMSMRPVHWARHLLRMPPPAAAHRRLHRIRAAAVRADGGADAAARPTAGSARPGARPC